MTITENIITDLAENAGKSIKKSAKKPPKSPKERDDDFDKNHVKPFVEKSSKHSNIDFVCDNYFVTSDGLYYQSPVSENDEESKEDVETEQKKPIWISSPIWPVAYLRNKDSKNHSLLIKVNDGEKNHLVALQRMILGSWSDLNRILLDLGQKTPTSPAKQKLLINFLMYSRPDKTMRCVDKAGWHADQYVFPDGLVIGEGKNSEGIYPLNDVCPSGVCTKGTLEEWQKNVLSFCKGNSRLIFSIGTALASLLLYLSKEEGGGFNLRGRSSTGKTKCLKVATSVLGSPEYMKSWKATANGLEGVCALHNDSLLPLDEFGQSDGDEVGQIAYMITAGIGKQRAARDGSPRDPKTWRTMILSTGETGLEDHMRDKKKTAKAGQLARVVDIPAEVLNGYGCFENLHGFQDGAEFADMINEACSNYYGTAGREFIKSIIKNEIEPTKKDLRFIIDDFVAENTKDCDGQVKRVANRFALVYAALMLAKKFSILPKSWSDDEIKSAIENCYNSWFCQRGTSGDLESSQLINQVKGLLDENSDGKFISKHGENDKRTHLTIWGYKEGSKFYVLPKAFKENLCNGFDSEQSAKILIKNKLLIPSNDGKSSRVERISAHHKPTDRFYVIDLNQTELEES